MIDKKEVRETIVAVKEKLANPEKKAECIAEIEKMIGMKQSHVWRADLGSCCGNVCNISSQIEIEIGILQGALDAVKEGSNSKAASLLEDYLAFVEEHYDNEHPNY
jgi:hypothetical protein